MWVGGPEGIEYWAGVAAVPECAALHPASLATICKGVSGLYFLSCVQTPLENTALMAQAARGQDEREMARVTGASSGASANFRLVPTLLSVLPPAFSKPFIAQDS